MGALSFLTTIFGPAERQVEVNPKRCLRNRLRGNQCKLCLEACPAAALSYSKGSLHFKPEACSNCMACVAVCPVDALVPMSDLQQIVDQVKHVEHDTLIMSCEHNRLFRENELLLPCLGVFSHELLVSVASVLQQKRILFNIRGCDACCNQEVSRRFEENLNCLLQYSDETAVPKMKIMTNNDSSDPALGDRRSFLKAMQSKAVNAADWSRNSGRNTKQQTATSRNISLKTGLLKKVLESNDPAHPLATGMVPRLSIGKSCTPCPRCAGICPTGALKLARLERGKKLEFDNTSCCSCGLCLDFCKEEALTLSCSLKT